MFSHHRSGSFMCQIPTTQNLVCHLCTQKTNTHRIRITYERMGVKDAERYSCKQMLDLMERTQSICGSKSSSKHLAAKLKRKYVLLFSFLCCCCCSSVGNNHSAAFALVIFIFCQFSRLIAEVWTLFMN